MIEDGAVLIRDGLIECVGSSRRIENLREARNAIEIPVHGLVVVPGFVDQGLSLFLGDHRTKSLMQARHDATLLLANCLQHGSVSAEIEAGGTESFEEDLRFIRQGSKVADNYDISLAWRISSDYTKDLDADRVKRAVEQLISRKWVRSLSLSEGVARKAELREMLVAAAAPIHQVRVWGQDSHVSTLGDTRQQFLMWNPAPSRGNADYLAQLADLGTPVLFRPLRDLLHMETEPVMLRDFIQQGGIPVLATAHHRQESPGFNMQAAIALAVLRHGMTIEQAVTAATNNAAWSLGWGRDRGTIEAGKRADMVVLDIDDFREIPRQFGNNDVAMVVRRGAIVFNRTSWREPPQTRAAAAR